ncbi:MAG: hypothetical protein KJ630_09100 [Proteobacteria bacterium]|nr:hypothetical protein [Pseudomonadota bacterium]
MTNILYGVHGIGHGHAIRALTIARFFPQHNFLFLSDRDGYDMLFPEYNVLKLPANGSPAFKHAMPYSVAVASYLKNFLSDNQDKKKTLQAVESFQPDLAITDYESNLPWICRITGLSCLSIDHQHIARFSYPKLPFSKSFDLALLRTAIWMQFRDIRDHMIISFFNTPIKSNGRVKIFPPILRQKVLDRVSSEGDHVLAYHGYSTTSKFHQFLLSLPYPVRCYGMKENKVNANVTYKKNSTDIFLDDLASCRYVVSTAGHTLLSEALFYGKPVMAFPIRNACEQFLNGYFLEINGYGLMNDAFHPSPDILDVFEKNLDFYRKNIQETSFCGNETVVATLKQFFKTKKYIV